MSAQREPVDADRVALRVVSGRPTDEELAAVVAVLATASAPAVGAPEPAEALWSRPAHRRAHPRTWAESRLPR